MGNHHSHSGGPAKGEESVPSSGSASQNGSKKALSRSASGADIQDKSPTQLSSADKLAKVLCLLAQREEQTNGVTERVFGNHVFPKYRALSDRLYAYFHALSKSKTVYISCNSFKQQVERFLGIIDDQTVLNLYVRMFSNVCDENQVCEMMSPEGMRELLMTAYHVTMDHYSEGPQMCLSINKTLQSVVDSCFYTKQLLSHQFVAHWLEAHTPRLLLPLHRYIIHTLTTVYRNLEQGDSDGTLAAGLELATPVLEQAPPFPQGKRVNNGHLLHMSLAWLLAGALPPSYSRPQKAHSPTNSGVSLTSQVFLSKLVCALPSHWVILYDSDQQGLGSNRFLHHVMAYRGPTLCLLKADSGAVFCICSTTEWKESHLYWGGEDSAVFQLLPKFILAEKGSKMIYLNTQVRGYPQGLRAGKDPRKPIIIVDSGFEKVQYKGIPYNLDTIEVWGCGDQQSRETQLDIKKWQVKEAERQRSVKLSANEWLDHPDRYLLELAGRPQYNNQT